MGTDVDIAGAGLFKYFLHQSGGLTTESGRLGHVRLQTVNIHEAKTHLSKLVDAALRGEEIAIARRNKPLVKLLSVGRRRRRKKYNWAVT